MSSILQQTLRGLCYDTGWCYAVFWKLKRQARMVLTWEDAFYEPKVKGKDANPVLTSVLEAFAQQMSVGTTDLEDPIGLLVSKMSYHVYSVGEGIIGRVAFTNKHQWVFSSIKEKVVADVPKKKLNLHASPEKYPSGWEQQFAAGIKTISVIAVPQGVVQLGSTQMISEDMKLVGHVKALFGTLQNVPGAFLSDLVSEVQRGEVHAIYPVGVPALQGDLPSMSVVSPSLARIPSLPVNMSIVTTGIAAFNSTMVHPGVGRLPMLGSQQVLGLPHPMAMPAVLGAHGSMPHLQHVSLHGSGLESQASFPASDSSSMLKGTLDARSAKVDMASPTGATSTTSNTMPSLATCASGEKVGIISQPSVFTKAGITSNTKLPFVNSPVPSGSTGKAGIISQFSLSAKSGLTSSTQQPSVNPTSCNSGKVGIISQVSVSSKASITSTDPSACLKARVTAGAARAGLISQIVLCNISDIGIGSQSPLCMTASSTVSAVSSSPQASQMAHTAKPPGAMIISQSSITNTKASSSALSSPSAQAGPEVYTSPSPVSQPAEQADLPRLQGHAQPVLSIGGPPQGGCWIIGAAELSKPSSVGWPNAGLIKGCSPHMVGRPVLPISNSTSSRPKEGAQHDNIRCPAQRSGKEPSESCRRLAVETLSAERLHIAGEKSSSMHQELDSGRCSTECQSVSLRRFLLDGLQGASGSDKSQSLLRSQLAIPQRLQLVATSLLKDPLPLDDRSSLQCGDSERIRCGIEVTQPASLKSSLENPLFGESRLSVSSSSGILTTCMGRMKDESKSKNVWGNSFQTLHEGDSSYFNVESDFGAAADGNMQMSDLLGKQIENADGFGAKDLWSAKGVLIDSSNLLPNDYFEDTESLQPILQDSEPCAAEFQPVNSFQELFSTELEDFEEFFASLTRTEEDGCQVPLGPNPAFTCVGLIPPVSQKCAIVPRGKEANANYPSWSDAALHRASLAQAKLEPHLAPTFSPDPLVSCWMASKASCLSKEAVVTPQDQWHVEKFVELQGIEQDVSLPRFAYMVSETTLGEQEVAQKLASKHEIIMKGKKRLQPDEQGWCCRKDRQKIQDCLKELRAIVPDGAQCSIETLLKKTLHYMSHLQTVHHHPDKESQSNKLQEDYGGNNSGQGFEYTSIDASWVMGLDGQGRGRHCPIVIENLSKPGQILVEMICEEKGKFLEIANCIRRSGLTILTGIVEERAEEAWARFVVEGSEDVHRVHVLWSLMQLLK